MKLKARAVTVSDLEKVPVTVTGRMTDNTLLSPAFVAAMMADYAGTRLGRQELDGELIDDVPGALWTRDRIDAARCRTVPPTARVVIGVDPSASIGGDACGIVAVALGEDGLGYVVEDASIAGASPEQWARAVADCAHRHAADRVVAETNNGGNMVEATLRAVRKLLPLTQVKASRGKSARAEPVAALYSSGQVRHVGLFPEMEDEMCGLLLGGGYVGPGSSPDRADALVWALTELMLGKAKRAGVRTLG